MIVYHTMTTNKSRQVILDRKIARIIETFSERYNIGLEEATDLYYNSVTSQLIEDGVADLHCRSDKYLADELWIELHKNNPLWK